MNAALVILLIALTSVCGSLLVVNHILGADPSNEEAGHA